MHTPRKRFGQHFLTDPSAVRRIIDAIRPRRNDCMLEIGPGAGVITAPLLQCLSHLYAVEIDTELAAQLQNRFPPAQLSLFRTDILKFDLGRLAARCNGASLRIVGNLPYNISTPLLFRLAEFIPRIQDCHLLLQKEVVQRMVAQPGSKIYGRLSVMCQYYFHPQKLFDIGPRAFRPPPKVDSSFIRLLPAVHGLELESDRDFRVLVRSAFSQRRKTLGNALKKLLDTAQIRQAGVDPSVRAETLKLEEFVALSNRLSRTGNR